MTLDEARDVLDAVRDGVPLSEPQITDALRATGDIGFKFVPAAEDDVDLMPVVQRVLRPDQWPRKPPGLAPAQWHEVIA